MASAISEMSTATPLTLANIRNNPADLSQDLGRGDRWRAGAAQECQGFVFPSEQVSQQMTNLKLHCPYPTSLLESIQTLRVPKSLQTSRNL